MTVWSMTACGSGEDEFAHLPPLERKGLDLSRDKGCASCHGKSGQGGVGPTWVGLSGSEVELDDGTTVTADSEYLKRSIVDPGADRVAGFTVQMPNTSLTPDEVDAIVAFIEAL